MTQPLTQAETQYRQALAAYQQALASVKPLRDAYLAALDGLRAEGAKVAELTG